MGRKMVDRTGATRPLNGDGAGSYIIVVQGKLEQHWEPELRMRLSCAETEQGIVSTLTGQLPDQSALLGILSRLAMWGYLILSVNCDFRRVQGETSLSQLP